MLDLRPFCHDCTSEGSLLIMHKGSWCTEGSKPNVRENFHEGLRFSVSDSLCLTQSGAHVHDVRTWFLLERLVWPFLLCGFVIGVRSFAVELLDP